MLILYPYFSCAGCRIRGFPKRKLSSEAVFSPILYLKPCFQFNWSGRRDSNPRQSAWKAGSPFHLSSSLDIIRSQSWSIPSVNCEAEPPFCPSIPSFSIAHIPLFSVLIVKQYRLGQSLLRFIKCALRPGNKLYHNGTNDGNTT